MKTFPRATLLIADSPFGMNKDSWDGQAPSKGAVSQFLHMRACIAYEPLIVTIPTGDWEGLFKKLLGWDFVAQQFKVVVYASTQMLTSVIDAAVACGCSSNYQHLVFMSDKKGHAGPPSNALNNHLMQSVLLFFFKKTPDGGAQGGGGRQQWLFDFKGLHLTKEDTAMTLMPYRFFPAVNTHKTWGCVLYNTFKDISGAQNPSQKSVEGNYVPGHGVS
jgi:hypothetical protein